MSHIRAFQFDPIKDSVTVEFQDGTVRQIAYSVLLEDKNKELRQWVEQQIIHASRMPGHLMQTPGPMPNAAAVAGNTAVGYKAGHSIHGVAKAPDHDTSLYQYPSIPDNDMFKQEVLTEFQDEPLAGKLTSNQDISDPWIRDFLKGIETAPRPTPAPRPAASNPQPAQEPQKRKRLIKI